LELDAKCWIHPPESYTGYKLVWADGFNSFHSPDNWIRDPGDGCPSNCGDGGAGMTNSEYYKKRDFLADANVTLKLPKGGKRLEGKAIHLSSDSH